MNHFNISKSNFWTAIFALAIVGLVCLATRLQWYVIVIVFWIVADFVIGWREELKKWMGDL